MTLHPQAQALLEFMSQHPAPDPAKVPMPEVRAALLELSRYWVDAGLPIWTRKTISLSHGNLCRPRRVPEIARVQDVECPGLAGPLRIRVYNPVAQPTVQQPALIYIHGGGWCLDSVESHDAVCRGLAVQANIVVLSVDYRLAPEHPFPAGVDDCYAAAVWICSNAEKLSVDPTRIAIGGDSAGGNLTLTTLLKAQQDSHMHFACQLLLYPIVDIPAETESRRAFANGFGLDDDVVKFVLAKYAQGHDAKDPFISPYYASDLSFMPPTLIFSAENDPLVDEAKLFADRLQKEGVACTYRCCKGMVHGFMNHMYIMQLDAAEEATSFCAKYLRDALGSAP